MSINISMTLKVKNNVRFCKNRENIKIIISNTLIEFQRV